MLNLRASPLMRWAAKRVGRGAEASLFQEVAEAAIHEVEAATGHGGFKMVTESALLASMSCVFVPSSCSSVTV